MASQNENLLLKEPGKIENKKTRGRKRVSGNLLTDIKREFQLGCLRGEMTKRGCVKVKMCSQLVGMPGEVN